jgi:ferredoxin
MTLLVLALAAYFIIRLIVVRDIRALSTAADYILIVITSLPFLTGYFLTHGTLEGIPSLGDNMGVIHMLSGEAMILMAVFLFCRTRLNPAKCTGCSACELACPTGTIETEDRGKIRKFSYSHYKFICCGSCVNTCPEKAAQLRHEVSASRFFQIAPKYEIRSFEMKECERCGKFYAPDPLMDKIGKTFTDEYLVFCPDCRKTNLGDLLFRLSPWHKKPAAPGRPGESLRPV